MVSMNLWRDTAVVAGLAGVPIVGGPLAVIASRVLQSHRDGAQQAGEVAIAVVGDAGFFLDAIQSDDRLAALLVNAAEAASRTAYEDKRKMLGLVVGRAVLDPAQIDESELAQAAIRDFEAVHLHCLEALIRAQDGAETAGGNWDDVTTAVLAESDTYPAPVLSTLIRTGCAHQAQAFVGVMPTAVNMITPFGRYIIEELRTAARDLEVGRTNEGP